MICWDEVCPKCNEAWQQDVRDMALELIAEHPEWSTRRAHDRAIVELYKGRRPENAFVVPRSVP